MSYNEFPNIKLPWFNKKSEGLVDKRRDAKDTELRREQLREKHTEKLTLK